jgi:predicted nucleic acid-binding protein
LGLVDELEAGSSIAFDTNCVIYFLERNQRHLREVESVLARVMEGRLRAHVSAVTLAEVLVRPLRQNRSDIADVYREVLTRSEHFTLHECDAPLAERAALVRAATGLRLPDAIVAATGLESSCSHLVSNDPAFRRVDGLRVLIVDDFI